METSFYSWKLFIDLLSLLPVEAYDSARAFHDEIEKALRYRGFAVDREVSIKYLVGRSERRGRIDLVACFGTFKMAVELDNRTARKKSIEKVKAWAAENGGYGYVVLRNPREMKPMIETHAEPIASWMTYLERGGYPDKAGRLKNKQHALTA